MKPALRRGLVAIGLALAAGWAALRPATAPEMAEGRAWLAGFVGSLVDPALLGARGPAALARFPAFGAWPAEGCTTEWRRVEPSAPIVTQQRLELGRMEAEPCEQAQFGALTTTLRQSEGVTAGAFAEMVSEQFGPPEINRDSILGGSISYHWDIEDGIFIQAEEDLRPGGGTFSVRFVRFYAAAPRIPAAAEGEAWMAQTVGLLTGPLPAGPAVVALMGNLLPQPGPEQGCTAYFNSDLLRRGPIATSISLILDQPASGRCAESPVSTLHLTVWQRAPVTVRAMVERLGARLGEPAVSRDFEGNAVSYRWRTPHGASVGLREQLATRGHWFSVNLNRE